MEIETALAKVSLERVKRRDPENLYHKMKRDGPGGAGARTSTGRRTSRPPARRPSPRSTSPRPDFFKGAERGSSRRSRWTTGRPTCAGTCCTAAAPLLPAAFVNENFDFYGKTLTGAKELRPRWKRCVDRADNELGEALGQRYVEKTFGAEGKERMAVMVAGAREGAGEGHPGAALDDRRHAARRASRSCTAITNKIGYPGQVARLLDRRRSPRDDAVGNARARRAFEFRARAGQDRQAGGPRRVGDDAAHRQRVLQPAAERHQLPGRASCSRRSSTTRWTTP